MLHPTLTVRLRSPQLSLSSVIGPNIETRCQATKSEEATPTKRETLKVFPQRFNIVARSWAVTDGGSDAPLYHIEHHSVFKPVIQVRRNNASGPLIGSVMHHVGGSFLIELPTQAGPSPGTHVLARLNAAEEIYTATFKGYGFSAHVTRTTQLGEAVAVLDHLGRTWGTLEREGSESAPGCLCKLELEYPSEDCELRNWLLLCMLAVTQRALLSWPEPCP